MALYLVEKTFDGEPIGVWNDSGESSYTPGAEAAQQMAEGIVKASSLPWSVWVAQLADKIGHRRWWGELDSSADLAGALEEARQNYFSQENSAVLSDE